jgi:DNA ligase (NAD+)
MDIDGLSEKTIRKMYDVVGLRKWQDLYELATNDRLELSGEFGPKTIENFKKNVNASRTNKKGDSVLCALGIPMIGKLTSQKLLDYFGCIESIVHCSINELASVEGVGCVAAQKLYDYINNNRSEFDDAFELLTCSVDKKVTESLDSLPLYGMTILATGTLENFKRDEIKASVIENGGKYASGVSGKLTFMIVGSDAGKSKLDKANALGVKIITESEYLKMIS